MVAVDSDYLTGLSGCQLRVVSAGGSSGIVISGSAVITTTPPVYKDADIFISSGGAIELSTNYPVDLGAAYTQFIADKQDVMYSGGSCVYAGNAQSFLSGGYAAFADTHLMTLQGVTGAVEKAPNSNTSTVNININPTVGCWTETDPIPDGTLSVVRTRKPCVSCDDWNNLYVLQMMLYHAINRLAWRIMRSVWTDYPVGLWQQYQGAVTRWNINTYAAQYVYDLQSTEDTFLLKFGWINTTCTPGTAFAAYSNVVLNPADVDTQFVRYRLLYGGAPTIAEVGDSDVCAFVALPDASAVYYLTSGHDEVFAGVTGLPAAIQAVSGYTPVDSIQDLNVETNTSGRWLVGIVCKNIGGDGYGAFGVQLGYAAKVDVDGGMEAVGTSKWRYDINTDWSVGVGTTTLVPAYTRTDTAFVNALQTPTDEVTP